MVPNVPPERSALHLRPSASAPLPAPLCLRLVQPPAPLHRASPSPPPLRACRSRHPRLPACLSPPRLPPAPRLPPRVAACGPSPVANERLSACTPPTSTSASRPSLSSPASHLPPAASPRPRASPRRPYFSTVLLHRVSPLAPLRLRLSISTSPPTLSACASPDPLQPRQRPAALASSPPRPVPTRPPSNHPGLPSPHPLPNSGSLPTTAPPQLPPPPPFVSTLRLRPASGPLRLCRFVTTTSVFSPLPSPPLRLHSASSLAPPSTACLPISLAASASPPPRSPSPPPSRRLAFCVFSSPSPCPSAPSPPPSRLRYLVVTNLFLF
jgi:hypothetical protein